jgi:hypothetical protein
VTVMLDSFFGVHPHVVRSGLWARMKPGEHDLYVFLMERSERYCSREIHATDAEIKKSVGLASRTACNARKKLQEYGLIQYRASTGNRYTYVICDPKTGQPYPGDPKARADTRKPSPENGRQVSSPPQSQPSRKPETAPCAPESYGFPLKF